MGMWNLSFSAIGHMYMSDGVRTVRMVRARAIPRNLTIDGFHVKVSYPGQAPECDICYDLGHIAKNCPLRGKCLECRQSGHLQRDCPVRLRRLALSEDSVANLRAAPPGSDIQDANSALDFDALSGVEPVANVSGSVSTDSLVELRDNQLDEITSQSVLADAIPACTSATVPDQIDSVQPKLPIVWWFFRSNSQFCRPNSKFYGCCCCSYTRRAACNCC